MTPSTLASISSRKNIPQNRLRWVATAICICLSTPQFAPAQSQTRTANTQSARQESSTHQTTSPRTAPRNETGTESRPEWSQSPISSQMRKPKTKQATSDDYRTQLEIIRDEKRRRLEEIHQRLQALLDKPSTGQPGIFDSQIESSVEQDVNATNSATTMNSATDSRTELPESDDKPAPIQLPPPVNSATDDITSPANTEQQTPSDPAATLQPDSDAPKSKPRSQIADMIDALAGAPTAIEEEPEEEEQAPPKPLTATTVLNSPVDRLKLADSLFAAGEYGLSLQMYDAIDRAKISSSDRTWLKYQQASCKRKQGMIAEAESIYRQIAGEADAEWLAETSRWWLDRLSDRKELEDELQQIQDVLDTFEKAKADADSTPKQ